MRIVEIAEIADNDYNLNISRFIDTSEPEPIVDIKAVHQNLADLEVKEADIDEKLAGFLKELGI
jgi:type I restriction enzyme M protein